MRRPDATDPETTGPETTTRQFIAKVRGHRPNGRAALGGLLVAIAGIACFTAIAEAETGPHRTVLIARHRIDIGQRLTTNDVEPRNVRIDDSLGQHSFLNADLIEGAVAIAPMNEGEMVQRSAIVTDDGAGGFPEFSLPVDRERAVNGDIRPGEIVDVLATYGTGNDAVTVTLANSARVIRIEDLKAGAMGSSGRLVVTIALRTNEEILESVHAAQVASITLVRTTSSDAAPTSRNSVTGPLARGNGVRS